ncbi:MAG: hypothetical protein QM791_22895 [Ferruginibacter sp.]
MESHIKIIGSLLIILALIHASFPRFFNWKQELSSLSLINRQLMYVHAFFIALVVFLLGILCVTSPAELVNTHLGKKISLGIGLFWAVRLYIQFFGYSPKVWKGKAFETAIHIFFSIFWAYLTIVFMLVYFAGSN